MRRSRPQNARKASVRAGQKRTKARASHAVDYEALAQFRHQLRKFLSLREAAARKSGLTPQQHQALLAIKGFSRAAPVSVGELADLLLVRHHTAVGMVYRMTKLGLLARIVDDNDSRRILLKPTRRGEQKLRTLSKMHLEELQAASLALTRILRSFRRSQRRYREPGKRPRSP